MILKLIKWFVIIKLLGIVGAVVGLVLQIVADAQGLATGPLAIGHPQAVTLWSFIGLIVTILLVVVLKGVFGR